MPAEERIISAQEYIFRLYDLKQAEAKSQLTSLEERQVAKWRREVAEFDSAHHDEVAEILKTFIKKYSTPPHVSEYT